MPKAKLPPNAIHPIGRLLHIQMPRWGSMCAEQRISFTHFGSVRSGIQISAPDFSVLARTQIGISTICVCSSCFPFRALVSCGYVLVKFTDTCGGTELGLRLDNAATNLSQADFRQATGRTYLVAGIGSFMLYTKPYATLRD